MARKVMKRKKRSCALCKPHKMNGDNRWKAKEYVRLRDDEKLMKAYRGARRRYVAS